MSTTSTGINSCSPDSRGIGRKIFSSHLSIQSVLMQPLLENMKDILDRVQIWTSCQNGKFPTSSQADPAFKLFHEGSLFPHRLASCKFLNMLAKCSRTNEENYSLFILIWYCSVVIIPFPYVIVAQREQQSLLFLCDLLFQ